MKLVIASGNNHKIQEIKAILSPYFSEMLSAKQAGFTEEIEESGNTFYENALIKAKTVCRALNCAALADDSGIVVDALGGKPGVYSARYSGKHGDDRANNLKLLKDMEGISDRSCRFICSVVIAYPDGTIKAAEGVTEGRLLYDFEGSSGFGYDSLFYSYELEKSFGNAAEEEKNLISHRAKALQSLVKML